MAVKVATSQETDGVTEGGMDRIEGGKSERLKVESGLCKFIDDGSIES